MTLSSEDRQALAALDLRLRTILPEEYENPDDVQPISMGSASLKYGRDGKVAWDDIWESFCDLAMAGGPPHKGILLDPGSPAEIMAQPDRYREVVAEIRRGIRLVADLPAEPSAIAGWVRVDCENAGMAGWLVRAIVMENVSARWEGTMIDLPAGPNYRIDKEIKNVITAVAKTCHYWIGHMWQTQRRDIANLFSSMSAELPLLQPAPANGDFHSDAQQIISAKIAAAIGQATGLRPSDHKYSNWLGIQCPDVRSAIWMMRALVVSNVLSRREGTVLFVPVNPESDPHGETVARCVARTHRFAKARRIL